METAPETELEIAKGEMRVNGGTLVFLRSGEYDIKGSEATRASQHVLRFLAAPRIVAAKLLLTIRQAESHIFPRAKFIEAVTALAHANVTS
jgi:hypothetical protein